MKNFKSILLLSFLSLSPIFSTSTPDETTLKKIYKNVKTQNEQLSPKHQNLKLQSFDDCFTVFEGVGINYNSSTSKWSSNPRVTTKTEKHVIDNFLNDNIQCAIDAYNSHGPNFFERFKKTDRKTCQQLKAKYKILKNFKENEYKYLGWFHDQKDSLGKKYDENNFIHDFYIIADAANHILKHTAENQKRFCERHYKLLSVLGVVLFCYVGSRVIFPMFTKFLDTKQIKNTAKNAACKAKELKEIVFEKPKPKPKPKTLFGGFIKVKTDKK
jgi:hypothetical protein